MEIVINTCFGGFKLSPDAERFLAKLQGKEVFFYIQTKYNYRDGKNEYIRIDKPKEDLLWFTLTKDLGEIINDIPDKKDLWFNSCNIKRNDKNLIVVIRILGEKASGKCAKLKVMQIPNNIKWEISEYDGNETIKEKYCFEVEKYEKQYIKSL